MGKRLAGQLYHAGDPEIQADALAAKACMVRYNAALGVGADERRELLRERLGSVGDGAVIRTPFHCDFGYNASALPDSFALIMRQDVLFAASCDVEFDNRLIEDQATRR